MDSNIFSFSATHVGYNHLKVNKVCEDASDYYDDDEKGIHVCVVSDGHGSDNYPRTDKGARFAVDSAIKSIVEFVEIADPEEVLCDEHNNYEFLRQLSKNILLNWHNRVEEDVRIHPFTNQDLEKVSDKYRRRYISDYPDELSEAKAYGCTLIAFAVTPEYSFGLQIGDGKCVVIDSKANFGEPIPWDENCQLNITTSICDSDALDEFRFYLTPVAPMAVFCGSDGIDDSYSGDEELYALYRSILKIFIEHDIETGKSEIEGYLPILTKRGSGDDVSIAMLMNYRMAKDKAVIFDLQAKLFDAKRELNEKQHRVAVLNEKIQSQTHKLHSWVDAGVSKSDGMEFISKYHEMNDEKEILESEIAKSRAEITETQDQIVVLQTKEPSRREVSLILCKEVTALTLYKDPRTYIHSLLGVACTLERESSKSTAESSEADNKE